MSEVLPQLKQNKDQLEKLIENGKDQITKKGIELNKFREEHNIKIKNTQEPNAEEPPKASPAVAGKSNVLVS